ncbi:OsWAK receptor-like protein kinase [Musa troglodytarum]|uniref:OsWAK receptor-like protein kinase n=1 Tax=Musa troglodytarum TaxID=320322 RepID=A0A9E7F6H9_9LILI|nr:OsWAK receptor-like protein kinase [Musa troglodytarum]
MGSTNVESASTKETFTLPSNCTKRCGNINFEFPFGIGTGCYREGFNLTCTDNTTKPLRLFLGDGKLMITRIDLDNGTVRVKTPVITMGVDHEFINVPLIDLQKWPYSLRSLYQEVQNFYTIDTYNRLYVSGCSVVADLVDPTTNRTIDTCITRCTSNDNSHCILSLYDWNSTSLEVRLTRLNQSDLYLLDASIIKVFVYDYYNSTTDDLQKDCPTECGGVNISFPFGLEEHCYRSQAFALTCNKTSNPPTLIFQGYYIVHSISLKHGQLLASAPNRTTTSYYYSYYFYDNYYLDLEQLSTFSWVIESQNCEEARQNGTTFACVDKNSLCVNITKISNEDIWGYRCNCPEGYQGNPYIANGCKDIDECSIPNKNVCNGICRNTIGGYECLPDKKQTVLNKKERLVKLKLECYCAGVVIGVSLGSGLLLLSISFIILRKKWKQRKQKKIRERHFHQNHGLLLQQLISSNEDVAERTKIFSLEEIEKATNNFDETRVLGRGGHGTVYKGILSDQRVVAIKKSKIVKKSEIDQFINEVAILSQINHRNIVRLFGCCLETEVPLLVYEFISNGTLADHLHVSDGNSTLSWEARLKIATETAGALAYLHSAASISILHRDVKSSNILLDDHFMAKVSDFGASRFIPLDETHIITVIQGTFGYLDPEYYQTSQLTEKSDVYSFGVILLELLTGKKPVFSIEHENRQNLSMHFLQAMKEKHSFDLVEDRVMKEGTKQELLEIIQLIEMCLKLNGIERPTMKEVEHKLQNLRRIGKKKGCPITEGMEETEYLLSDSSYTFSDSIDQTTEGTSRNYSLEKEFLWSLYNPR